MHEVLTLSLSQSANHLTTHFYNSQESYINYTTPLSKQTDKSNDPSIHFKPTVSQNSINYTPRALLWDLNGGYGALGQFEYFNQPEEEENQSSKEPTVISKDRVPKNEYQTALDQGKSVALKPNDVNYFTDFSRVIFEPRSYNVLQNWEFDPVKYPKGRLTFGKEREFTGYDVGVQEFKNDSVGIEFMEEKYRVSLEGCDLLNGINIVSELDSSWSGFSGEVLDILRDDYSPKSEVFSYLLYDGGISSLGHKEVWDRIRGFLKFQKESSLVLPFDQNVGGSVWEASAIQNVAFESVQVLASQTEYRKTFHELQSSLTLGDYHRNIVSKISWKSGEKKVDLASSFFQTKKQLSSSSSHSFSTSTILRPSTTALADFEAFKNDHPTDPKDRTKSYFFSKVQYPTPDSYPADIISPDNNITIELGVESRIKRNLIEMKEFVSKFIRGDERSDAIDALSSLAQEYEFGFGDSDEESDDDY